MKIEQRFWSKVIKGSPGECWEWAAARAGGRDGESYGYFSLGPRSSKRMIYAHRLAYQLAYGPIPDGAVIRHRCDNGLCCNPAHLLSGTQADNVQDMIERGRLRRGEEITNAILTEQDIPIIRDRLGRGERHHDIADDFGVCRATISQIASGRTWAWL